MRVNGARLTIQSIKRRFAMKLVRLIGFALALLAAVSAAQAVPNLISYQGVLMNSGGVAVPDGIYTLTLRLYSTSSGDEKTVGLALTSGDIAIQKTSTEAANTARIERELTAMKERLAAVEQEIRNEKR
jgi:hypothetical protein